MLQELKKTDLSIFMEELQGMDKAETARKIIEESLRVSKRPVVFCSFGKDSTVLLDMVREFREDVDVVYLMDGKFPEKNLHAFATAVKMGVRTLHTYPPSMVDYMQKGDYFEVLHFYYVNGDNWYVLYNGCAPYKEGEDFVCAKKDLIQDFKFIDKYSFPWDCIFHGQKETESIYVVDTYKIKTPIVPFGNGVLSMPLFDWTDVEVLDYAKKNEMPIQNERYDGNPYGGYTGTDKDKLNNDVIPTCFKCMDYRIGNEVVCPKTNQLVQFWGKTEQQHKDTMEQVVKLSEYISEAKEVT